MSKSRTTFALLSLALLGLVGCTDAPPSVTGVVEAPNGEIAARPSTGVLALVSRVLVERAWALTGLEPVGEGVEVRLQRIDGEGDVTDTLVAVETFEDSYYYIELASAEQPSSSLIIVAGGSAGTRMRAFMYGPLVDIGPASEAAVRLVLDSDSPLGNFSPAELIDIQSQVDGATADVPAGDSIAEANDAAEEAAAADPGVRAAIAAAGAS